MFKQSVSHLIFAQSIKNDESFSKDHLSFQIPEYCRNIDEKEVSENVFQLIFAFDEIVALGYRESVNLAQIKTFTEMDSHDEKVYQAVRQVYLS